MVSEKKKPVEQDCKCRPYREDMRIICKNHFSMAMGMMMDSELITTTETWENFRRYYRTN